MSIGLLQGECTPETQPDVLVLLPGMDGTGLLFDPFIRSLPANHQAVIIRYPEEEFLGYQDLADRVHSAIPKHSFVLIAESFSGPIAVSVAARRPPGLKAIVFVNSFVRRPLGHAGAVMGKFIPRIVFDLIMGTGLPHLVLSVGCRAPEVYGVLRKTVRFVNSEVLSMRLKAALRADASEMLKCCTARTICLTSSADHVIGNRKLRDFIAAKPDTEVVTVPGPHLLLQCAPSAAVSALRNLGLL